MKRSYRLLFLIGFAILASVFVTKTSVFRVDAQGRVVFQKKEPKLETTSQVASVRSAGNPVVLINEIDADTPGTDVLEFVEIYAAPATSLDGLVLVFFTGSNNTSYAAIDLDGLTADSNGLVLVGNAAVAGVDRTFADNLLQNGEDAVAIYVGNPSDFPNGTLANTANIVDALVYDTADPDDPELLDLLNPGLARVQIDEASGTGGSTANGIQRCLPGARDGRSFVVRAPTPNVPNLACQDTNVDMNGDRKTDFVITREISGFSANAAEGPSPRSMRERMLRKAAGNDLNAPGGNVPAEWWGVNNGAPGGTNVVWGDAIGDFIISADFDGDNLDDVAVWRPGPPETAAFYSINSSDLTYRVDAFGQTGDNPTITGDYDGDGRDDSATFRCPPTGSGAGQCYFFYRGTANNPTNGITYIPWGYGEAFDFFPYPGDFDGDGKHDFCLQAVNEAAPQQAIFLLQKNDATFSQEYIHWGYSTDFLIPGDFDGDGRSDFAVMRSESGRLIFYILHRDGSVRGAQWGLSTDFAVPGDYDGDGRQDIAIYRWNSTNSTFWILPSNGTPHWAFEFGVPGDVPVANWYVQ